MKGITMKKINWKSILGWVAAIIIVFGIVGYNIIEHKHDNTKIKIGIIIPMSGGSAVYGDSAVVATKIFQEKHPDFPVKFIFADNESFDTQKTITAVQRLVNLDKVDVLLTFMSPPGLATRGIAENEHIPHFGVATDEQVAKGKYNFTIATSPKKEAMSRYNWVKKNGYKRIVYVLENSVGIKSYYDEFVRLVKADNNIELVDSFYMPTKSYQFRNEIVKIKHENPDALLVDFITMPMADNFLRQAKEGELNIPYTGGMAYLKDKSLAEGIVFPDVAGPQNGYPEEYERVAGNSQTNYSEYIYALLEIIQKSYPSNGNKEDFLANIYKVVPTLKSAVGNLSINADGYIDADSSWKQVKEGKIVPVEK